MREQSNPPRVRTPDVETTSGSVAVFRPKYEGRGWGGTEEWDPVGSSDRGTPKREESSKHRGEADGTSVVVYPRRDTLRPKIAYTAEDVCYR